MSDIQPSSGRSLKSRVGPALTVFVVATVGIYATVWVGLGLLRHVVMPAIAVIVGGYLALRVYRYTGRGD